MAYQRDELSHLLQYDWRETIIQRLGTEPWITAHATSSVRLGRESVFSALVPNELVERVLGNPSWDLMMGNGKPGCTVYHHADEEEVRYLRFGNDSGIEPFVIYREFHGIREPYLEILEEFRLFHNLYYDRQSDQYVKFTDNGDEDVVVRMLTDSVSVRLKELRQFLAIKEMHLAIFFDVVRYSTLSLQEVPVEAREAEIRDDLVRYSFHVAEREFFTYPDCKSFSRLLGKKLITPLSKEKSGIWPYEEMDKQYEEFIIGIDQQGDPITYSCDHEKLANYFGANPHAPHYLTPVFFKREVLSKYYANPQRFSVEDGYLRCGGLWGIHIDNNHPDYVIVFLGDLGRDLHYDEQKYWRSFNVVPEGDISRTNYQRSFLAEFADPEQPDLFFKYRFEDFQQSWYEKMGWYLFMPLTRDDQHLFTALRIPLTNDQAEFDGQVLAMTKIIIDSLNEEQLQAEIGHPGPELKGITKLERFLGQRSMPDHETHIKFLRNLQSLRSAGVGHRKGHNYDKIAQEFGMGERNRIVVFKEVLKRATDFIEALADHFL